jgi:NADH-quinone oxidoreductase subunit L
MTAPLLLLALLAVVAGALKLHVPLTAGGIGEVVHFGQEAETTSALVIAASFLLAMAGIGVAWAAYRQKHISPVAFNARFPAVYHLLKNAWYLNRAWELFATRVVIAGSRLAAWFDRHIVNGMVDGVGWLSGWTANRLRTAQTGQMQFYALVFICALIAGLIVVFGRDQTLLALVMRRP